MTASVLVSGKLLRDPERKLSKTGKQFVSGTVKDGDGDHTIWWTILCFGETECEKLLALHAGDGVAVSGSFKVEPYQKDGASKLRFTIFADGLLSAKKQKRERRSPQAGPNATLPAAPPRGIIDPSDDSIPF